MFCTQCGTPLLPTEKFCSKCGTALKIMTQPTIPQSTTSSVAIPLDVVVQVRPWVRFWARSFDIYLFVFPISFLLGFTIFFLLELMEIRVAAKNLSQLYVSIGIMTVFLLVFVEALLLSKFGTTPGKWLLKTKLTHASGEPISYSQAVSRSLKVWWRGLGGGLPFVQVITQSIAYRKLKRNAITSWDREGDFVVTHEHIGIPRTLVAIVFFIVMSVIISQQNHAIIARSVELADPQVSTTSTSVSEKSTEQQYLTDEEVYGENQVATKQNPFDQFDKKPTTEESSSQNNSALNTKQDKATDEHFNTISKAIPDFDQIVASGELVSWIDRQPSLTREQYKKVAESGTASEVIDLLTIYKNNQNDIENEIQQRSNRMKQFYEAQDFYAVIREAESGQYLLDYANILGISLYKVNQFDRAIQAFQQAEKAFPATANFKCNLGDAYLSSGSLALALTKYCEAHNIDSTNETYKQRITNIQNRTDLANYGYSAKRVSVDFFKIDIHKVFQLFSDISGIKINADRSIQGSLTLTLNNIPWDLALDVVLNMSNLAKRNYSDSINVFEKTVN